jgi:hypothetical protein
MNENFENVKVGDLLISHHRHTKSVVKVERVTPAQLVVTGGKRFRKKDGYGIGGDSFYYSYITIPKEGEVESIRQRDVVVTVCCSAKKVLESYNISYEQALKIKEILNV